MRYEKWRLTRLKYQFLMEFIKIKTIKSELLSQLINLGKFTIYEIFLITVLETSLRESFSYLKWHF